MPSKDTRLKSGLTQQELALKSGTTHPYISRIENQQTDIELGTLRKVIETGLVSVWNSHKIMLTRTSKGSRPAL